MTNNRYEPELKQKVLRLYLEEGRTKKSLTEEYNLGQGTLTYWLQQYRKECDNSPTK
ncbi:TPA: transposase, partial [Streptococcus suis]